MRSEGTFRLDVLAAHVLLACGLAAPPVAANPTGGTVVAGQAAIQSQGKVLTVTTSTQKSAINWQTFSISADETTRFVQPSSSSSVLNRVVSNEPSKLLGKLQSNGKVFLINRNGILVGEGASIDVAGFVASTLDQSTDDFLEDRFRFQAAPDTGKVENRGNITTPQGGSVYLVGPEVENSGLIRAPGGEVILAAGRTVTLVDTGTPGVSVQITGSDTTVTNVGQVVADAGQVGVAGALVRNSGTLNASSVVKEGGRVFLKATKKIELGDASQIAADGATRGGTVDIVASENGTVAGELVARGRISARGRGAPGSGGFVETSAANVDLNGLRVDTAGGQWLIDPADFTIAASGGNISGNTLSANLASNDVTILSSSGSAGGNGDIHVNDAVSWNANTLTLTAARDINVNAVMEATGAAILALNPATANGIDGAVAGGAVRVGFNPDGTFKGRIDFGGRSGAGFFFVNDLAYSVIATVDQLQAMQDNLAGRYALGSDIDASGTSAWNAGAGFVPVGTGSTPFTGDFHGLGHTVTGLVIDRPATDDVGLFGSVSGADLRAVGLEAASVQGQNNVGVLVGWFQSGTVADSYSTGTVGGNLVVGGLVGGVPDFGSSVIRSHSAADVTQTVGGPLSEFVGIGGLVGFNVGTIDASYASGAVAGISSNIGGLVGFNGGSISRSHATGAVSGGDGVGRVGGLAGSNSGVVQTSYATGAVSGGASAEDVGGLVGYNAFGEIGQSYATGPVSAGDNAVNVGGLAGYNAGTIDTTYAAGAVSAGTGTTHVGGLVGAGNDPMAVTRSYWDVDASGQSSSAGGSGLTTAQMKQAASFASWDFATVWGIDENLSYPYLLANEQIPHPGLPSIAGVFWDGGAGTFYWTDPLNWSTDTLPGPSDSVTVDPLGLQTILLESGAHSVYSLAFYDNLSITGGSLTIGSGGGFFAAGTTLVIDGGTLTIDSDVAAATVALASGTLSGAGTLTVTGTLTQTGGAQNGTGTTVLGAGAIGDLGVVSLDRALVNEGTLILNGTSLSALLTNRGTLDVAGSAVTSGVVQTAGLTRLAAGQTLTVGEAGLTLAGGTLTGRGAVGGWVSNTGGIVAPGDSPGTLSIAGDYVQGPAGMLALEVGGMEPGAYDVLNVSGAVTLGGTLQVTLFGGFLPPADSRYDLVLAGGGLSGTFGATNLPAGYDFVSVYESDRFALQLSDVVEPEPKPPVVGPTPEAPGIDLQSLPVSFGPAVSGVIRASGGPFFGVRILPIPAIAGTTRNPRILAGTGDLLVPMSSPFAAGLLGSHAGRVPALPAGFPTAVAARLAAVGGGSFVAGDEGPGYEAILPVATAVPFPLFYAQGWEDEESETGEVEPVRKPIGYCAVDGA